VVFLFAPASLRQLEKGWVGGAGVEVQKRDGLRMRALTVHELQGGVAVEAASCDQLALGSLPGLPVLCADGARARVGGIREPGPPIRQGSVNLSRVARAAVHDVHVSSQVAGVVIRINSQRQVVVSGIVALALILEVLVKHARNRLISILAKVLCGEVGRYVRSGKHHRCQSNNNDNDGEGWRVINPQVVASTPTRPPLHTHTHHAAVCSLR